MKTNYSLSIGQIIETVQAKLIGAYITEVLIDGKPCFEIVKEESFTQASYGIGNTPTKAWRAAYQNLQSHE